MTKADDLTLPKLLPRNLLIRRMKNLNNWLKFLEGEIQYVIDELERKN